MAKIEKVPGSIDGGDSMVSKTFLLLTFLLLAACRSMQNYDNPDAPLYAGAYAESLPEFDEEIKVITWNIRFAEKIETAIAELQQVEALQGADLILLQEMDEAGVEAVAKALKYNFIYFPASIHTYHNKDFGNAILSPWPLAEPQKVLLPHRNPKNQQMRIAVRGLAEIGELDIPVYSVHTETAWLGTQKRQEQLDTLLRDIGDDSQFVIVGGDFNTFTAQSIIDLERDFEQVGLDWVSRGAGPTFEHSNFGFTLDYIFAKGFAVTDNGVWPDTQASDHFPLWTTLSLGDE